MLLNFCVCVSNRTAIQYGLRLHNPHPGVNTDLVSFKSPPFVHSVRRLGGEHCHVVPIGLGNKGVLQRVESQAWARVTLLVAQMSVKMRKEINSLFDLFFFLLTMRAQLHAN